MASSSEVQQTRNRLIKEITVSQELFASALIDIVDAWLLIVSPPNADLSVGVFKYDEYENLIANVDYIISARTLSFNKDLYARLKQKQNILTEKRYEMDRLNGLILSKALPPYYPADDRQSSNRSGLK